MNTSAEVVRSPQRSRALGLIGWIPKIEVRSGRGTVYVPAGMSSGPLSQRLRALCLTLGAAILLAATLFADEGQPRDAGPRGMETGAVRLEAAQLTGSPEGMRSTVASTQPMVTLAVTADPEKGAHSATHAQSDWLITLVEPEVPTFQPPSTDFPSLAVDPLSGFPAVAYRYKDTSPENPDELRFAQFNGSVWQVTPGLDVDPGGWVSLAFDATGRAAIAYNRGNQDVYFVERIGGVWSAPTKVSNPAGQIQSNSALVLDPGGVAWVAYHYAQPLFPGANYHVKVAAGGGTTWTQYSVYFVGNQGVGTTGASLGNDLTVAFRQYCCQDLLFKSIPCQWGCGPPPTQTCCLDPLCCAGLVADGVYDLCIRTRPDGSPGGIAYVKYTDAGRLYYAENINGCPSPSCVDTNVNIAVVDGSDVSGAVSLAYHPASLDPGISYLRRIDQAGSLELRVAEFDGTSWNYTNIESGCQCGGLCSGSKTACWGGGSTSIAYGSTAPYELAVAYNKGGVRVARRVPAPPDPCQQWNQLSPSSQPAAFSSYAMAYDAARAVTVLFGGRRLDLTLSDETWLWDGMQWSLAAAGGGPPARFAHSMAYDALRGVVVLFGGYDGSGTLGDTWQWDGVAWTQLSPGTSPWPRAGHAMAYDAARDQVLLFGGDSNFYGDPTVLAPLNDTWAWDGVTWQQLGSGIRDWVLALTVYNGELVAGGYFTTAGGTPANAIARWDGATWQPLGSGIDGAVYAVTVYDGELIAGGSFTSAGGTPANFIARWDGATWQPLGSGIDGAVYALTVYNGELVAGGVLHHRGRDACQFHRPLGRGNLAAAGQRYG